MVLNGDLFLSFALTNVHQKKVCIYWRIMFSEISWSCSSKFCEVILFVLLCIVTCGDAVVTIFSKQELNSLVQKVVL